MFSTPLTMRKLIHMCLKWMIKDLCFKTKGLCFQFSDVKSMLLQQLCWLKDVHCYRICNLISSQKMYSCITTMLPEKITMLAHRMTYVVIQRTMLTHKKYYVGTQKKLMLQYKKVYDGSCITMYTLYICSILCYVTKTLGFWTNKTYMFYNDF